MAKYFTEFFKKFPMQFSELFVVKQIHKTLECAEKEYKKHPETDEHLKYLCKAYQMLEAYFIEKGINPNDHI